MLFTDDILKTYPNNTNEVLGIVLHWSVSGYNASFSDYHICIDGEGNTELTTPIFVGGHFNKAAHLWHRNTGHIGVSVMSMFGATEPTKWDPPDIYTFPPEYGEYPPTKAQIDSLCNISAKLLKYFKLDISHLTTHYDWALIDKYADYRWDFRFEGSMLKAHIKTLL